MPDNVWWWVGAVVVGVVGVIAVEYLGYGRGLHEGHALGYSRGYTDAKAHAREKAALLVEETERERVARIARNRSEGARKAWRTRKSRGHDA